MKQCIKTLPEASGNLMMLSCDCGATILILPDTKEMSRVIEAHANEHSLQEKEPKQAETKREHIQTLLIKQLFEKIDNLEI